MRPEYRDEVDQAVKPGSDGAATIRLVVAEQDAGLRIDAFIAAHVDEISRSMAKRLMKQDNVSVMSSGSSLCPKPSYEVHAGDVIYVRVPPPEPNKAVAQAIPLDIVYEDSSVVVVNKPRGLVVHPAPGNRSGTLVNALLHHCGDLAGVGGVQRPGIVHRLDKDTSGLMVAAKDDQAYASLAEQIKTRTAKREYVAIVHGTIEADYGKVDAPVGRHPVHRKRMAVVDRGGKRAVTYFEVVGRLGDYTLVRCRLDTGRTHQIRVHMSYIGHPVVGDPVYGRRSHRFDISGQALHSAHLEFDHPRTGKRMVFDVDMPEDMREILNSLNWTSRTGSIAPHVR